MGFAVGMTGGSGGETVVLTRSVYRTFDQETAPVRALRGADLDVRRGEFVAVMGPSGCGKSTLLNIVAGLDSADEGEVVVADNDLTKMDENARAIMRRKHVGIVFQFFNLLEGMTVLENVVMPAAIAGVKRRAAEARARDLLDLLGLGDKAKQAPGVLSGGQRQRLAIARRWPTSRRSCSPTSPRARWTPKAEPKCSSCSGASTEAGRPSSWSRTTSRWPTPQDGSSG